MQAPHPTSTKRRVRHTYWPLVVKAAETSATFTRQQLSLPLLLLLLPPLPLLLLPLLLLLLLLINLTVWCEKAICGNWS
ncbi:hypothetical protein E2C01_093000 [Portunus trituberculatus]|uniref:Uncharacterized protein n=1 Tax=Portunus trituberculatus TaxID=210409 RepID=A0A5B7JTR0_PORTR|nr:hypothetical protein [Portunus trituberculatus]